MDNRHKSIGSDSYTIFIISDCVCDFFQDLHSFNFEIILYVLTGNCCDLMDQKVFETFTKCLGQKFLKQFIFVVNKAFDNEGHSCDHLPVEQMVSRFIYSKHGLLPKVLTMTKVEFEGLSNHGRYFNSDMTDISRRVLHAVHGDFMTTSLDVASMIYSLSGFRGK